MKKLLGFSVSLLLTSLVLASGKTPPSSDGMGTPRCAAYDAGSTEEHSPHGTCESCLSAHDGCDMKCFSYDYTCTAKVQVEEVRLIVDPKTKQQREERQMVERTFNATAYTRDLARERAMHDCMMSQRYGGRFSDNIGFGASGCSVSTCNENASESSRTSCHR